MHCAISKLCSAVTLHSFEFGLKMRITDFEIARNIYMCIHALHVHVQYMCVLGWVVVRMYMTSQEYSMQVANITYTKGLVSFVVPSLLVQCIYMYPVHCVCLDLQ